MKNAIITILVVILLGAGVLYFANQSVPTPSDEGTSQAAEATYANASADLIVVGSPAPGAAVPRTIAVSGQARGYWFFEASFPVTVTDADGNVLLETFIEAGDEWMTEEFVPFAKDIVVPGTYTGEAVLILKKDNPSGLPENDGSVSIPINIQ